MIPIYYLKGFLVTNDLFYIHIHKLRTLLLDAYIHFRSTFNTYYQNYLENIYSRTFLHTTLFTYFIYRTIIHYRCTFIHSFLWSSLINNSTLLTTSKPNVYLVQYTGQQKCFFYFLFAMSIYFLFSSSSCLLSFPKVIS